MDRFDDDTLFAELRELRPKPRPEFAAELDQRAAAGFPRGADTTASVFAPLADWWSGMTPTRRLVPVLATALAVVVVATAGVSISQSGGGGNSSAGGSGLLSEFTPNPSTSESAQSSSGVEAGGSGANSAARSPSESSSAGGEEAAEEGGSIESESELRPFAASLAPIVKNPRQGGRDIERSSYIVLG